MATPPDQHGEPLLDIHVHERSPPADPLDFMQARAWTVDGLLYGPERLRRALTTLQVHKDMEAEAQRELKRRQAQLLLELQATLKEAGAKTNAEQRDAMLQERVADDADCARLEERLTQVRKSIAADGIELAYQESVNGNARALARLLSKGE